MKRFGVFLAGVLMLALSLTAQNQTKPDTAKAVVKDSIEQLYMNENLDAREAILLKKLDAKQLMDLESMRLSQESKNEMPFSGLGLVLICLAPFIMAILRLQPKGPATNHFPVHLHPKGEEFMASLFKVVEPFYVGYQFYYQQL